VVSGVPQPKPSPLPKCRARRGSPWCGCSPCCSCWQVQVEGDTWEGNQGTGYQPSSEGKRQGEEEVSADPLGDVFSVEVLQMSCLGEKQALLGWWARAHSPLSLAQTLFAVGLVSSCWDGTWKPLLPSPCQGCASGEAVGFSPGRAGVRDNLQGLQAVMARTAGPWQEPPVSLGGAVLLGQGLFYLCWVFYVLPGSAVLVSWVAENLDLTSVSCPAASSPRARALRLPELHRSSLRTLCPFLFLPFHP